MYIFSYRWRDMVNAIKEEGGDRWLWYAALTADGNIFRVCSPSPFQDQSVNIDAKEILPESTSAIRDIIQEFVQRQPEATRESIQRHGALFTKVHTANRYQAMLFQKKLNAQPEQRCLVQSPELPVSTSFHDDYVYLPIVASQTHYFGLRGFDDVLEDLKRQLEDASITAVAEREGTLTYIHLNTDQDTFLNSPLPPLPNELMVALQNSFTRLKASLPERLSVELEGLPWILTSYSWGYLTMLLEELKETVPSTDLA